MFKKDYRRYYLPYNYDTMDFQQSEIADMKADRAFKKDYKLQAW